MEYIKLSKNYKENKLIPITDSPYSHIKDLSAPWFTSMFKYSEAQYQQWKNTHTLAGMTNSVTNKMWADFDSESNLDLAFADARVFVARLTELGLGEEHIQICFSGNKGIAVVVDTTQEFTNVQVKSFVSALSKDLKTFDQKMYDNQRIFRLPFTKNEKSGLFKIPLTLEELTSLNAAAVQSAAKDTEGFDIAEYASHYRQFTPTPAFMKLVTIPVVQNIEPAHEITELALEDKPKFLSNCRWSLQNGFFKEGERSTALLCLAATYKNLGFALDHVYRLLKGVAEIQSRRNDSDRYPDDEIYNNVVTQVFGPSWKGGQFTCRDEDNWLHGYCQKLGPNKCNHKAEDDQKPRTIADIQGAFKHYVKNIDQNTILTGYPSLDKNVFLSTGANVLLVGASGSGKTTVALDILKNTSMAGVKSVFASLDMHQTRLFEKVMYKVGDGLTRESLYDLFHNDQEDALMAKLKAEYGNVNFFKKSAPTVDDIKNYVINCQEETGEKIKLVMVDYFERLSSDFSDDTAASKNVAGQLQDLVDELDVCLITLVQPNKNALSGGVDQPIYDYTKIKGSSFLYQSARIILSCFRPFYSPTGYANDKYLQMAVLKNDLGELNEFAFGWNGAKGQIRELEDHEYNEFREALRIKEESKKEKDSEWK